MGVWATIRETIELKQKCKDVVLPSNLLLDSGFIMKGEIDMDLHTIKNVKNPELNSDAVTNSYVDRNRTILPTDLVRRSNASFITNITMNDNRITSLADPIDQYDAVHKDYVKYRDDLNLKLNEVRKMRVFLDMGDFHIYNLKMPDSNLQATNKMYVDTEIKNKLLEINRFLKLDGSTSMNAHLNMDNHRIENVRNAIMHTYVVNLGQLNRGLSTMVSNMLNTQRGGNLFGNLDMKNNKILNLAQPIYDDDAVTKSYVDLKIVPAIDDNLFVKKSGSTMSGNLELNNNRITGLNSIPTDLREAVCKEYIDKKYLILNFAVRSKSDAPAPFNSDPISVSCFYGYSVGNNPIQYGVSMIPLICANYFEYFPSGVEKIIRNGQKVNFIDLSRNNVHTILTGYGINLSRVKNQII